MPAELPVLDFSDHDTLYATHALHAFAAKCPPQLVRWAIERFTAPGELVVDPMVGSGTTLVESVLCGREAIGCDIDPLARLIAKVKSTPIPRSDLEGAISAVLSDFAESLISTPDRLIEYPCVHRIDRWFLPAVARDLAILKSCIRRTILTNDIRDFLLVAFSSLITARTSVANVRDLVHSRHHYRLHSSSPNVLFVFRQRLARMQRQMIEFVEATSVAPRQTAATVSGDDARDLNLIQGSADFVFTSPPYCNALDYTRAHSFSVGWLADELGMSQTDYVQLGRRYIGSDRGVISSQTSHTQHPPLVASLIDEISHQDHRRGLMLTRYFSDMEQVLDEIGRILKPGGRAVLVVCPSHIRKVEVPTHLAFVEMAAAVARQNGVSTFTCENVIERTLDDRRRLLPYMKEAFGHRMRTEYVVILRRRNCDEVMDDSETSRERG